MVLPLLRNPKTRLFYLFIFLLVFCVTAKAQVQVTATAATTGPSIYTTVKGAFDAINAGTHKGVVNIVINANTTETATASLNASGSGSASYTSVNIKPQAGTNPIISGSVNSGPLIKLNGSRNVTIDGSNNGGSSRNLTITNTSTASSNVLQIGSVGTTPISNVVVKNSNLINGTNTSTAVLVGDVTIVGSAGYFNDITIQNNSIRKAYIGIYCYATVATNNGNNTLVTENDLDATGANAIRMVGIYVQGVDGITVSNNSIGNFESTSGEFDRAIWFAAATKNATITGNTVYNMSYTGASSYAPIGINIAPGITNANFMVTNNIIKNLGSTGTGTTMGIFSYSAASGLTYSGNKISNIKNTNTNGYGAAGALFAHTITSAATKFYNNFIWDVAAYGYNGYDVNDNGNGVVVDGGGGYDISFNTIVLNSNATLTGAHRSSCFLVTANVAATGAINLRNNILANLQTVGNANSRLVLSNLATSGSAVFGNINYNSYYATSTNLSSTGTNASMTTTIAQLQTSLGGNANSVNIQPILSGANDLHLVTPQPQLLGTPIAGITTDIDGEARNATSPYMGADEYGKRVTPDANGIVYVKKGTLGNGLSWAYAVSELADALKAAKINTDIKQVWVAGGIYKPMYSPADNNFGNTDGRNNAFLLVKDVKVYGGFAGTETTLGQRDLSVIANKSTLSGDFNDDDIISGTGATLSFTNRSENAYNVLFSVGDVGTATLDGFTISGGVGGVSNTTINNLLLGRSNGGGMNIFSSSPMIANCTFQYNNVQTGMGGALYIGKPTNGVTAAPVISQSSFLNNSSNNISGQGWGDEGGGALYIVSSSPTISDCSFAGNLATGDRLGGAIVNVNSAAKFTNVTIQNNVTLGANAVGGGLTNSGTETLTLTNVILSGNSAGANGGAIYNGFGTVPSLMNNVLISGNTANNGGGIYNSNSSPVLTNVTISGNQASLGGGVYNGQGSLPQLQNTVVFGNSSGVTNNATVDIPVYRNSMVQDISATGLISFNGSASDLFVSPLSPGLSTGGDYKPKSGSALINAGDQTLFLSLNATTKDLAGNLRLMGANIDLGAYEVQNEPPIVTLSAGNTVYTNPNEVAVDNQITIIDNDNATLASATVTISGNKQAQDILSFTNNIFGNISGVFNNGVLTLTSAGATASLLQWQNALRTVKFNTAELVSNGTRTIDFVVNDGVANSAIESKTITLASAVANLNCDAATSQTNEVNGLCIGCSVTNSAGAVDTYTSTASTINITVGLLNAYGQQLLKFPSVSSLGDTVTVLLEGPATVLPADILGAIQISSYNGATSNGDDVMLNSSLVKIKVIGAKFEVKFKPSQPYDGIAIKVNSGIVNSLTFLNIYYASRLLPPPVANQSVVNTCVGTSATLTVSTVNTATVEWFDVPTGGTVLPNGQGNNFTTPPLNANKIYYAQIKRTSNSCENPQRTAVEVRMIAPASITQEPSNSTVNVGDNASFSVVAALSQGTLTYQWQVNKGNGFEDLSNGGKYSHTNTATLQITSADYSLNTYQYRCVVSACAQVLNSESATLTVNKLAQTLNFVQQTNGSTVNATYGDAVINASASSSASSLSVTYSSSDFSVATVSSNGQVSIVGKGTTIIKAIQSGNENYLPAQDISFSLNIAPRALIITATGSNKVYNATTTATVNLSSNALTGDLLNLAYGSANFNDKNVGSSKTVTVNDITISGTSSANYSFNTTASTSANITPFGLTVSASGTDKAYDATNTAIVNLSGNALVGDMLVLNYTNATFNDQNVGTGKIVNVTGIGISGVDAGNYTFNTSTITTASITPVTLNISAQAKTKTYGDLDPALSYISAGLIGTDAITGALARDAGENVGTYAIGQGTLTASSNYRILFTPANLTINRATLTVTAANAARCFGQANPSFALSYNGFKRSDNENSLATKPQAATLATVNSQAGNYPVTVSGGASGNYTFVYANGTLRVDALPTVAIVPSRQGTIGKGLTLQLTATGGTSYSWATAQGIISGQNSAALTIRPTTNTTYTVTATDANGCSSTVSYAVTVADDLSILKANNLLSPNGDGINDVWKVDNIDMYPQSTVRIFDRAGRVLYTRKGYDNSWDGTYNGQLLAESTYYYIIDLGEGRALRGFITLVRESR